MPSTSKKQHNFMEAVAHNPSFAKKVGVPQSVGSDFAKADKGRKFAQGGDMATKRMFGGKESYSEEMGEAKAVKSGRISPAQYARGEESEKPMGRGKKESFKEELQEGKAIKSGRVTPKQYAEGEGKEYKRGGTAMYQSFSNSGKPAGMKPVQKMAGGGQIDPRMAAMLAAKMSQGASQRSADPRIAAMLAAKASPARQAVDPRAAILAAKLRNSAPMKKGGMASGGYTKEADGVAQRGKTKAAQPKMFSAGGYTSSADGIARKGKTQATQIKMKRGGGC